MGVTRDHAEEEVKKFNAYYDKLSPGKQQDYYGGKKATIALYERCFNCGAGATFRPFKEGDCPSGVTIQPTIYEGKAND